MPSRLAVTCLPPSSGAADRVQACSGPVVHGTGTDGDGIGANPPSSAAQYVVMRHDVTATGSCIVVVTLWLSQRLRTTTVAVDDVLNPAACRHGIVAPFTLTPMLPPPVMDAGCIMDDACAV